MLKKVKKLLALSGIVAGVFLGSSITCFAGNLLQMSDFNNGVSLPWNVSESEERNSYSKIVNNEYMVHIDYPGVEKWDVQIRHRGLVIQAGHTYEVKFKVHATKNCQVYAKIGDQGDPYFEYWHNNKSPWQPYNLTANQVLSVDETFTASQNGNAEEFAFHLGGPLTQGNQPYDVYFDDIYLMDAQYTPPPVPTPEPLKGIRANQLGYYPNAQKLATLVSDSTSPVAWQLKNSSGTVVAQGQTTVKGFDVASGDKVHIIDFSSYKTEGKGYQLVAGTANSYPFDIATDMYSKMKMDALKYFYHARSSVPITLPYCVESQWARAAGHNPDTSTLIAGRWYTGGPATLDTTGGWYDAGDQGKYAVNGGISVWTMMNQYERAKIAGTDAAFADGTMNIPESKNSIPDILDESRVQVEVMMKLQVPVGYPKAGMCFHKAADEKWTALAVRPDQDKQKRIYYPPSTAATLNLAAIAAQASRLWKTYDSTFATQCLAQAEVAWDAAVANPEIYAPYGQELGSGTYGDDYVLDDFYWAACELYTTTGKAKYLDYIKASPHYLKMPTTLKGESSGQAGCFDWGNTAGLGTITLALVPSGLSATDVAAAKSSIQSAADTFMGIQAKEGYGVPLAVSTYTNEFSGQSEVLKDAYPWGSNSFVINESIVMAYAYDFTKNTKYVNGLTQSMDYLMGRNPMTQCYVTGYGEKPIQNPHHRFFAYQTDNTFPKAPPGFLSGGPNSGCQDPWMSGAGIKGSPAEKCFLDNIESWASNEVTINWNAPLAWVTAYLDEQGPKIGSQVPVPTPTNVVPTPTNVVPTPTPTIPGGTYEYDFDVQTTFYPTKLVANQMMTAKVTAKNVSATPYDGVQNVLLIVGLYDSNNTMVNVSYISKGIAYLGSENLSAGFKLPANITGYSVKAFMWDGTDMRDTNMIPLSNVTQLP